MHGKGARDTVCGPMSRIGLVGLRDQRGENCRPRSCSRARRRPCWGRRRARAIYALVGVPGALEEGVVGMSKIFYDKWLISNPLLTHNFFLRPYPGENLL